MTFFSHMIYYYETPRYRAYFAHNVNTFALVMKT